MGRCGHKSRKILGTVITVIAVLFFGIFLAEQITERNGAVYQTGEIADLTVAVEAYHDELIDSDAFFDLVFRQTGLGRPAVMKLLQRDEQILGPSAESPAVNGLLQENGPESAAQAETLPETLSETLSAYQNRFFAQNEILCYKIGIVTSEEKYIDNEGRISRVFSFADVRTGDVLLSKSTHSLGWRHGHAALVVDGEAGTTMESLVWGLPSAYQNISKWESYSTVIQLRFKDADAEVEYRGRRMPLVEAIALYAEDTVDGVPYGLLTGLPSKFPDELKKTQCSHLVWYPYYAFGYDIDSNGGWMVTPKDISRSDLFEVVQIYGLNPDALW